jgi:hypothetical protein
MNIERSYLTTVSPDDLAQALANHFRSHDFEAQVFGAAENATVMQARKENLWRQAVGTAYAVTVIITPREGQLSVKLGGHEWVDTAVSAGIGLLVLPPVLFGTVWGIWKEHSLEESVWQVIDERITAALPTTSPVTGTT